MSRSASGIQTLRPKRIWQQVNGVLLLDKPLGITSNHALQAARRLFNAEKGGHTGTLDPLATGLLPLCFGEATKFTGELLNADKRYRARVHLGVTTDTADAEGTVLAEMPVTVDCSAVETVLAKFRGAISQLPPMYSALKRDGKPLYAYARAGIDVMREPRQINIYELKLLNCELPYLEIDVLCSKGTYIRTLAADIGSQLGCGAHLTALRRIAIGSLDIAHAITLGALEVNDEVGRKNFLLPTDALLATLPVAHLNADQTRRIGHGQAVPWTGEDGTRLRLVSDTKEFLGVGNLSAGNMLCPERLIAVN